MAGWGGDPHIGDTPSAQPGPDPATRSNLGAGAAFPSPCGTGTRPAGTPGTPAELQRVPRSLQEPITEPAVPPRIPPSCASPVRCAGTGPAQSWASFFCPARDSPSSWCGRSRGSLVTGLTAALWPEAHLQTSAAVPAASSPGQLQTQSSASWPPGALRHTRSFHQREVLRSQGFNPCPAACPDFAEHLLLLSDTKDLSKGSGGIFHPAPQRLRVFRSLPFQLQLISLPGPERGQSKALAAPWTSRARSCHGLAAKPHSRATTVLSAECHHPRALPAVCGCLGSPAAAHLHHALGARFHFAITEPFLFLLCNKR